jgi:acyl-coenzyme A thioesterase PaaI-like protein
VLRRSSPKEDRRFYLFLWRADGLANKLLRAMKIPFLVEPDFNLSHFTEIKPQFPNWEKSFVSGPNSSLYRVSHFIHRARKTLVLTRVKFLDPAEGPPGNVHGGATAGLLDETMGIAVWHQGERCLTQKLELHYGKLLPLHKEAFVFTEIVASHEKTLEVHATIYNREDDDVDNGQDNAQDTGQESSQATKAKDSAQNEKTPRVSALGVFHRLSEEQLANFRARS